MPVPGAQSDSDDDAKKGLLGRFNTRFNDALQSGRGADSRRDGGSNPAFPPEGGNLAIRKTRNVSPTKMVIPYGVTIEGHLSGGTETEISGRIDGNITVEGRFFLGEGGTVTGNVRAASCRIEGLVEGKVECAQDMDLGTSGRLNAEVVAGKQINIAGHVLGNVTTPGVLRLAPGSKVDGDVRVRTLRMEEGSSLNGKCFMRPTSNRSEAKKT